MWWMLAGAAIGAAAGAINTYRERGRQQNELGRQKQNALDAYSYGKSLSDSQYYTQKSEALWQIGMQDRALREGMDQFMGDYNTQMLARAYGEQDARIQTASGIGASLVQEGMSGTRGNEANQLTRDYASGSLERQIGIQKQQDADTLAGTITNANRSMAAMIHEKNSWEGGGYRDEMKTAQDNYNKQMADLGQANYQYQINDMNSGINPFLDYTSGIFGGASSGASIGRGIGKFKNDFGNFFN